jgi:hypothetical protein
MAGDGTASLGDPTDPSEQVFATGMAAGRVAPYLIGVSTDYREPEFLTYDAADGFKVVTYDETADIDAALAGDLVKVAGDTVSSDPELLGLVSTQQINGAGRTLALGRKASGGFAAQAGLFLGYPDVTGDTSVHPDVDFGPSEGILYAVSESGSRWRIQGSLVATNGLTLWPRGSSSTTYALRLQGTNNDIGGIVTLLPGRVIVTGAGANGFGSDADVRIFAGATLDLDIAEQTYASLRGEGSVELANERTLTVTHEFEPGRNGGTLDFVNQGELVIGSNATFVLDLDAEVVDPDVPRVALPDMDLTIESGATLQVRSVTNYPAGVEETFVVATYASRNGSFADVEAPGSLRGVVTYDDVNGQLLLRVEPRPGFLFRIR